MNAHACAPADTCTRTTPAHPETTLHANAELLNRFYSAFQRGDAETMAACYHADARFSDPVFTALQGAEVLIYPTAIGWHPEEKDKYGDRQHAAWETVQRSHAIANGCFVVAVNRVGFEPDPRGSGGIEFWGQSFLVAPDGRVIARASKDREAVLVDEIDLAEIEASRIGWPFFRDRRVDAYANITQRFGDDT